MSDKLDIQVHITGRKVEAAFVGNIDEDATFEKLLAISMDEYRFDLGQVKLMNSCGIREWINFLGKLPSGAKVTYANCRQIIVEQMNMVQGFLRPGAVIESFYAPYFCPDCDREKQMLLKVTDVKGRKAPAMKCEKHGCELEFDAIEEQYFNFISK